MAVQAPLEALLPANATIKETEIEYVVAVDVSGFGLADLRVEIEDHDVTIHGGSSSHTLEESIRLPVDADVEWLRALYEPRWLELHVPRLDPCGLDRRPVEIDVKHQVP
jgi:HSP20 family molecular chaperone IbpA